MVSRLTAYDRDFWSCGRHRSRSMHGQAHAHGRQSGSRAEHMRALQKRRSKDSAACDGKAWTHAELRALEDGLVALGAGRAAELRAQVPATTWANGPAGRRALALTRSHPAELCKSSLQQQGAESLPRWLTE